MLIHKFFIFSQMVGIRPDAIPARRLGTKQLQVYAAAQNVVATRRRLITYEALNMPNMLVKNNEAQFEVPSECRKVQGVRLDYWQSLRDTLGPKCALFSRRNPSDLRAVLRTFINHYLAAAVVGF